MCAVKTAKNSKACIPSSLEEPQFLPARWRHIYFTATSRLRCPAELGFLVKRNASKTFSGNVLHSKKEREIKGKGGENHDVNIAWALHSDMRSRNIVCGFWLRQQERSFPVGGVACFFVPWLPNICSVSMLATTKLSCSVMLPGWCFAASST